MSVTYLPAARRKAFSEAFRAHYPAVRAFFARRAPAEHVEEFTADVFERAWVNFDQIEGSVLPWLYGVARNVVREHYRTQGRRPRLVDLEQPEADPQAEDFASHSDLNLDINRALLTLSPAEREILTLHAWEGLTPAELAEVLDLTPTNARVRLHRAPASPAPSTALAPTKDNRHERSSRPTRCG